MSTRGGPTGCSSATCGLARALDGMCVAVVVADAPGNVEWMNRSARRMLGLEDVDALGRPLRELLRDPNLAEFWYRARSTGGVALGDVAVHWPTACELKVNVSSTLDPEGTRTGSVLLFCDVSAERAVQFQLSQDAAQKLLRLADRFDDGDRAQPHAALTARELRVLRMVGQGAGNGAIAQAMHVAPSTTRTHLKHIYAKLGLSSRAEAIRYAVTNGLV